jgi:zinc transporter ZupT
LDELRRGEENMVTYLTYLVFGVCVSIGALIFFLLKRDANSSAEFQKRLAARKRKRPSINAAN